MGPRIQQYHDNYAQSLAVADQPKRPLSAYNLFFQIERLRLVSSQDEDQKAAPYTKAEIEKNSLDMPSAAEKAKRPHRKMHGKITFIDLAKTIASKWKALDKDERKLFEDKADEQKRIYAVELEEWLLRQVPTRQVKKRLSALRRGSLGGHLKQSKQEQEQQQQQQRKAPPTQPARSPPPPPTTKSAPARRVSELSEPLDHHRYYQQRQQESSLRKKIQLERARNLHRLYQMQIELYEEQVRMQEEYHQEQVGAGAAIDENDDLYYNEHGHPAPRNATTPMTMYTEKPSSDYRIFTMEHHHHAMSVEDANYSKHSSLYHPFDYHLGSNTADNGRVTPVPVDPFV